MIEGSTVFLTGANRGIGKAFVAGLLAAGAKKIYAAARNPDSLAELVAGGSGRVVAVQLDVTDADGISAAAAAAQDVDLLINNAGVAAFEGLVAAGGVESARQEMEVNYFGVLNLVRAFSPVLANNGGGSIINMASVASYVNFPMLGSYSASKAAVHSLTQGIRAELAAQGTRVFGVYPGPVDTDMAAGFPEPKPDPAQVVRNVFEAIEADEEDIHPDPKAVELRGGLRNDPKGVEKMIGEMLPT